MSTVEQERPETRSVRASQYACENCGSVTPKGMMSWCPDCGFYPEIEKFRVEECEPEEIVVEEAPGFAGVGYTQCTWACSAYF